MDNKLTVNNRNDFRAWLADNAGRERECWVVIKRGRPVDEERFWYIDAVEEALCFGWIDSVWKNIDGVMWSRFSPRQNKSPWTELNKERVRRLERIGLMTDAGRAVLPNMSFVINPDVEKDIRDAGLWATFEGFPPLYRRVRAYNLAFARTKSKAEYARAFEHFKKMTSQGRMYGEWNDYGRLEREIYDKS